MDLSKYTEIQEKTVTVRIFESRSKPRFDALQQRLTVEANGKAFSQAQVMEYLLDLAEKVTKGE